MNDSMSRDACLGVHTYSQGHKFLTPFNAVRCCRRGLTLSILGQGTARISTPGQNIMSATIAPLKFGHGDGPPFPHVVEFTESVVCRHAHYVVLLRRCLAVFALVRILDLKRGEIRRYGAGTSPVVLRPIVQADRHHVQLACGTSPVVLRPFTRTELAFHGAVCSSRYIKHVVGARPKSILCAVWLDLGVQIGRL